jgi:hypothetical protein
MIPKWILIGVAMTCTSAVHAVDGAPQLDEVLGLACTGTMIAGDHETPGSRIVADGIVDFLKKQVRGFGVGSVPIIFASAAEVRFGSSPIEEPLDAPTIEGTIDRTTGKTRIVVRSSKEPARALIAMTLDCRLTPSVS